jgi:hypothetical protein
MFVCTSFSSCPTSSRSKHSEEIEQKKKEGKLRIDGPSVRQLANMESEERTKILQEKLLKATEAVAQKELELEKSRNASQFQILTPQQHQHQHSTEQQQSSSSQPRPPLQEDVSRNDHLHGKRNYAEMSQDELKIELNEIRRQQQLLKRFELNILFNLRENAEGELLELH